MSRYFSGKYKNLTPYTPGEQPQNRQYIKLNTNESPFRPSEKAIQYALKEAERLQLYSDPECSVLRRKLAENLNVGENNVIVTNGSDEILNFAFMAFCDESHPAAFPDISYGFYPVFAKLNNVPYVELPLRKDFTIDIKDYFNSGKTIFIANPNAPTGIALTVSEIEEIIRANSDNVVVIDEAYVDFGAASCVSLINKYENLLVTRTFSKSRSMAGARLGFGVACESLIRDLNTMRFSTNPYNVNRMTMAAGVGCLEDEQYTVQNCGIIEENREYTKSELERLGFSCLDSKTNFIFAAHNEKNGKLIYELLKKKGILVRHFDKERISGHVRISIGTKEQMCALIAALEEIL